MALKGDGDLLPGVGSRFGVPGGKLLEVAELYPGSFSQEWERQPGTVKDLVDLHGWSIRDNRKVINYLDIR